MFDGPTPNDTTPDPGLEPGIALQLPADAYWHLVRTLRLTLPPPLGDNPAELRRRDHAAIARVAALAPANAAEAELAAQFVAASEQWKDCLRLAQEPTVSADWAMKCRSQAIGMMRQANNAIRLLQRMQERRRRLEADNAASDRLAWSEHCALALMAEALMHPTPSGTVPGTPTAHPTTSDDSLIIPASEPESDRAHPWDPQPSAAEPDPDLIAAAERYAATYPERAASIRRTGRLPHDPRYFEPPEAALAKPLIAGRTPALCALD